MQESSTTEAQISLSHKSGGESADPAFRILHFRLQFPVPGLGPIYHCYRQGTGLKSKTTYQRVLSSAHGLTRTALLLSQFFGLAYQLKFDLLTVMQHMTGTLFL